MGDAETVLEVEEELEEAGLEEICVEVRDVDEDRVFEDDDVDGVDVVEELCAVARDVEVLLEVVLGFGEVLLMEELDLVETEEEVVLVELELGLLLEVVVDDTATNFPPQTPLFC